VPRSIPTIIISKSFVGGVRKEKGYTTALPFDNKRFYDINKGSPSKPVAVKVNNLTYGGSSKRLASDYALNSERRENS
jgi:hypothetical protein